MNNSGPAGRSYVCHDHRLGPRRLPRKLPLMSLVSDYDRLDRLTPNDFLAKWTDAAGLWVYPPQDGFVLDTGGRPIAGNMTLQAGAKVDRFGSEYGRYVSAAEAPYNQRSLPPSNLDCVSAFSAFSEDGRWLTKNRTRITQTSPTTTTFTPC